ncbi:MAG: hypothetical protein IKF64_03210 [Eubacterium sp.]|nr:hypothetical protein [Eubacterium sp.]
MNNTCPKCGEKLSPFYLKQNCPHCGVDLLYYKLDERLEADAAESERQVEKIRRFADILKASAVSTPLHIIRLVLFFTPLLSMCLTMYIADHKKVSLISFILGIVNHGFDIGAWSRDYLFSVLAIVLVIVLSLAVIINSLFSATEHGYVRNYAFSLVNTAVFVSLSLLVCVSGGAVRAGFYVTLAIYAAELLLHFFTGGKKLKLPTVAAVALCVVFAIVCSLIVPAKQDYPKLTKGDGITVVSFNTAAPWGTPLDDTASGDRAERFVDYMKNVSPSLIGTQELNSAWLEKLSSDMHEYDSYCVKRGGDEDENKSEMNGVFWLKEEFTAIETNTFWLSQTPEKESRFTYTDENGEEQEAGCNRICSYAVLNENKTNKKIAFLNTHLDNSSEEAIEFSARLLVERINGIKEKYGDITIILTGDFNQTDDGEAYKAVSAVLHNADDSNQTRATWQDWGYTDTGDKPIDFIFTSSDSSNYAVLDYAENGYISDHYGIKAEVKA